METDALPAPGDLPEPRLIRRYANRKLYDTSTRGFTSLRAIEQLVLEGEEVQVIDHETGKDLTDRVLGRVLGSTGSSELPLSTLIRMPARVARAIVEDNDDTRELRSEELRSLREQVEELTRIVAALVAKDADSTP